MEIDQNNNAHDQFGKSPDTPMTSTNKDRELDFNPDIESQVRKKKSIADRMKTHRFLLVRGIYYIFYSVWAIVMAIGMFIAWLIALLFI